ncbi:MULTISPECIES: hypothetical protein [Arthrobacter]|uniref:hypothetical protein n=1 Tax=Arthrobacter TaxID=1663 RepID=UPI000CE3651C|nr:MULTISPECIES: hypothetical protein [Arthrobacter]MBO0897399.1 hypothetical protein [Arthrobacter sunyaminii]
MKYVLPAVTVLMAAAGLAVWIFADNLLLGLGLVALALLLGAVAPGIVGRLGTDNSGGDADPARVKEYRAQHPGTTIADAIRATRQ